MGNQLTVGAHVSVEDISSELKCIRVLGSGEKDRLFSTFHCLQPQTSFELEIRKELMRTTSSDRTPHFSKEMGGAFGRVTYSGMDEIGEHQLPSLPPPPWYCEQRQWSRQKHLLHRLHTVLLEFSLSNKKDGERTPPPLGNQTDGSSTSACSIYRLQDLLVLFQRTHLLLRDRYQKLSAKKKIMDSDMWNNRKLLLEQCRGMLMRLFNFFVSTRPFSLSCAFPMSHFIESPLNSSTAHKLSPQESYSESNKPKDREKRPPVRTVDVVIKVFSHPGSCSDQEMLQLFRIMTSISSQLRIVEEVRCSSRTCPPPANFLFCTFPLLEEEIFSLSSSTLPSIFSGVSEEVLVSPLPTESLEHFVFSDPTGERKVENKRMESPAPKKSSHFVRRFPPHIYFKRPFIASSLPERLSARPYLSLIERLFLAFQLCKAVQTLHEDFGITHGDLKPANVMIQSSGWLVLVDLAPCKPALLPIDGLALFDYFYNTEQKRLCFAAPEKFVASLSQGEESSDDETNSIGTNDQFQGAKSRKEEEYLLFQETERDAKPYAAGSCSTNNIVTESLHKSSQSLSSHHHLSDFDASAGAVNKTRFASNEAKPAPPSTTGFSLKNINVLGHTATMDMFSLGAVLVFLFTEESVFSLSDVLTLRSLFSSGTPEWQTEREELIQRILLQKQRIQGVFQFSDADKKGEKHLSNNTQMNNKEKRSPSSTENETEYCSSSSFHVMAEKRAESSHGNENDSFSLLFSPNSRLVATKEMLFSLLASLPSHRPSSADVLQKYTPSIFPSFFDYIYESVFPLLLVKDPDDQLLFFSQQFSSVLSTCRTLELEAISRLPHGEKGTFADSPLCTRIRFQVSYQVVAIFLPSFLTALRAAATQESTFLGLSCLNDLVLPYVPCLDQIKNILPHLLFIFQHPEEYDGRCRLLSLRLVHTISRSHITFLLKHTPGSDLFSTFSHLSPFLIKRYSKSSPIASLNADLLESMVSHDPYLQPDELMESGMIFETLILPALQFCICQHPFNAPLFQDNIVLLGAAEMAASFVSMGHICLEWQHNYVYYLEGTKCSSCHTLHSLHLSDTLAAFASSLPDKSHLLPDFSSLSSPVGSPSPALPSAQGIPFEKRKVEALLTLWQMYLTRFQEMREVGWKLFHSLMTHHTDNVKEQALSSLTEWMEVVGPCMTQTLLLPLLMEEVQHTWRRETTDATDPQGRCFERFPPGVTMGRSLTPDESVLPYVKERIKSVLLRQCIVSFSLPTLLHLEWGNTNDARQEEENGSEGREMLHEGSERVPGVHGTRSYFDCLDFFVSCGLQDDQNGELLCVVLEALLIFLHNVSTSPSHKCSSHPCDGKERTKSRRFFPRWKKKDISYLLKIVSRAAPLLGHADVKVGFSAAGVIVEAAPLLASYHLSFVISLCRVVRPFLTEPVPLLTLQSAHVFLLNVRRSTAVAHPFFSSILVPPPVSTLGMPTPSEFHLKKDVGSAPPATSFPFSSRLGFVFRDVSSLSQRCLIGVSGIPNSTPATASELLSALSIGVHFPLVLSHSSSFLPFSKRALEGTVSLPKKETEEDLLFPPFHLFLNIDLENIPIRQAVRISLSDVLTHQAGRMAISDKKNGTPPNSSSSLSPTISSGESKPEDRIGRRGERSWTQQEKMLSTLQPSAVPLLTYYAEDEAVIHGLIGVGHDLIFAAGSKGFAALLRWKSNSREELEEDVDGSHALDGRSVGDRGAPVFSRYSATPTRHKEKVPNITTNRYRSHPYLEVVHRFPWHGEREEERESLYAMDNSLRPSSRLALQKVPHTYTTVQSMQDLPADPLSSVVSSSPAFVAAGTSLGDVLIFDVERGVTVYTCEVDPERRIALQKERAAGHHFNDPSSFSCPSSPCHSGITSLFSVQSNVICITTSTGCVGLMDTRVPCDSQECISNGLSSSVSCRLPWSSPIPFETLGIPTSSCGLYHGQQAYGAVIGTDKGACQLVDFRFQRSVKHYFFHSLSDEGDGNGDGKEDRKTAFDIDGEGRWGTAAMEDVWSATSWRHRSPGWGIEQVCVDPLGETSRLLSEDSPLSSAPWLLLASSAGPVYRFHLSSGRYFEAFHPGRMTSTSDAGPSQRLWVAGASTTRGCDTVRKNDTLSRGDGEATFGFSSRESLRVFSGGKDGHLREWNLTDVMISTGSAVRSAEARSSSFSTVRWVPSPHSLTFHRLPFFSSPYFIRVPPSSFFAPHQDVTEGHFRRKLTLNTLLMSTIVERNDLTSSSAVFPAYYSENSGTSLLVRNSAAGAPLLGCSPPPMHRDAVTALSVVSGNEFQDSFSSLCLMSASRDGVVQIWRNKTHR